MSANKKPDKHINVNLTINIGNVYVQNNEGSAANNLLSAEAVNNKSSFLDVLAKVGGFIKRLATKIFSFIRKALLSLI